jgi:uncharacterized protein DUF4365
MARTRKTAAPKKAAPKKLSPQARTGQLGVNLVEKIVLTMGCGWHPTNQSLDVGIDGEIELVEPSSHAATNSVVRVQVKATFGTWPAESQTGFEFPVDERDLNYWLSGNTPVVLIVTRPLQEEAYWVDLKAYFANAATKRERRIRFEKATMAFTKNCLSDLFGIARPKSIGLYFAPPPKEESLYTNLLEVRRVPTRLWLAETSLRPGKKAFERLREHGLHDVEEFVIDNRRFLTPHELTTHGWGDLIDRGTVEDFDPSEWSDSPDADKRRLFVQLLNRCLYARAWQLGIGRRKDDDALYFRPTEDLSAREVPFRSVKEESVRTVFRGYPYTKGEHVGEIAYYRHAACNTQFRRYDGQWYLEILPTYHFTSDGYRRHPLADRYVSGMKRQEKQGPVMYQLVMWASILRGSEEVDADVSFWEENPYPFLGFGPLRTLTLGVGIDDKAWLPNEDQMTEEAGEATMNELPLFEVVDPYKEEPGHEAGP